MVLECVLIDSASQIKIRSSLDLVNIRDVDECKEQAKIADGVNQLSAMQMKSKTLQVLAAQDVQHANSSTHLPNNATNQTVALDQFSKQMVFVQLAKTFIIWI